jgi:hypothetical protein
MNRPKLSSQRVHCQVHPKHNEQYAADYNHFLQDLGCSFRVAFPGNQVDGSSLHQGERPAQYDHAYASNNQEHSR